MRDADKKPDKIDIIRRIQSKLQNKNRWLIYEER